MTSKHAWKAELIPWDYESKEHVTRLYDQRIACGFMAEKVPSFVEAASHDSYGRSSGPWDAFGTAHSKISQGSRDQATNVDIAESPQESSALTDTANRVRLTPREPSGKQFTPIGHIALDIHPANENEKLGLPRSGVVWVHHLYISYTLQRRGLGVAAMSKAEQIATLEPLNASIMALDTLIKEIHMDDAFQKISYDDRGLSRPVVSLLLYTLKFKANADLGATDIE
ncbi:MAG: hypothetical protein Q9227_002074 [Pyrenula ochraceoflavens]